jgi:hypothetical protein
MDLQFQQAWISNVDEKQFWFYQYNARSLEYSSPIEGSCSMKWDFSKMWMRFTILLLSFAQLAMADSCDSNNDDCGLDYDCHYDEQDYSNSWYVSADLLIWKPCIRGIPFASIATTETSLPLFNVDSRTNEIHDLRFKWDEGFRLGLGYYLPCSCSVIDFNWTHYDTDADGRVTNFIPLPPDSLVGTSVLAVLSAPLVDGAEFTGTSTARGHWDLKFNLYDLDWGRNIECNSCFSMKPHLGIRAAWIKQKYNITIEGPIVIFGPAGIGSEVTELKSEFSGGGLRAGLDVEYSLGYGWSLYGSGSAGVIYGEFDNNTSSIVTAHFSPTTTFTSSVSAHDHHCNCLGYTDFTAGIRWKCLCWDCHDVFVEFGWEQHSFYQETQFLPLNATSTGRDLRSSLCLDGFRVGATIDF